MRWTFPDRAIVTTRSGDVTTVRPSTIRSTVSLEDTLRRAFALMALALAALAPSLALAATPQPDTLDTPWGLATMGACTGYPDKYGLWTTPVPGSGVEPVCMFRGDPIPGTPPPAVPVPGQACLSGAPPIVSALSGPLHCDSASGVWRTPPGPTDPGCCLPPPRPRSTPAECASWATRATAARTRASLLYRVAKTTSSTHTRRAAYAAVASKLRSRDGFLALRASYC
jgi:hypothetical protein